MERPGDGGDVKLGVVAGNCVDDAKEIARGEVAEEADRHPNRGRSDQDLVQGLLVAHSATLYSMLYLLLLSVMSHIFRNDVVFAQTMTGLVICLVGCY